MQPATSHIHAGAHARPWAPSRIHVHSDTRTYADTGVHTQCSRTCAHEHMYTPTLHALTHTHTQAKAYTHSHSETHGQTQTHPHVHRQPVTPHADRPRSRPKPLYQAHLYPSLRNPQATEELVCGCPLSTTHQLIGQEVVHTVPQPAARPLAGRPGITVAAERDPDQALEP